MRKIRSTAVFAIGLASASGCDRQMLEAPSAKVNAPTYSTMQSPVGVRAEEAGFFELAKVIPGFGGYFFDPAGNMVVYLTDTSGDRVPQAMPYLERLADRRRGPSRADIIVRRGQYDFAQLAHWRDLLSERLLGAGLGVRSADADEALNRVVIGIGHASARSHVQRLVTEAAIPSDAVVVVDEAAVIEEGVVSNSSGVASANGEFYGGMEIRRWTGTDWRVCTMGFYATRSGVTVGVTNSHCSQDRWSSGADGTQFMNRAQVFLGAESHDRSFHDWCPTWYNAARWCRDADALLFDAAPAGLTPGMRKILRYVNLNPGNSEDLHFLQTDLNNPLTIVARTTTRVGDTVNKAGISTGWTRGFVTATCKDVELAIIPIVPSPTMRCQHEASYGRADGDSGAPVFVMDANGGADLRGIHWGHYPQVTGYKTVFSPISGIERDFGALGGLPMVGGENAPPEDEPPCDPDIAIIPC